MSFPLSDDLITRAYLEACRLDVAALKPGNVHRYAPGHGMDVVDFEKSAEISAPRAIGQYWPYVLTDAVSRASRPP